MRTDLAKFVYFALSAGKEKLNGHYKGLGKLRFLPSWCLVMKSLILGMVERACGSVRL